jgi:tripartite-type tricarboxylate transporter receptor subunit TctC
MMGIALCFGAGIAAPAEAASGAAPYQWNKLVIFIGFSAFGGVGGYDTYGRVMGRHIGKYLPGNPVVVPENRPGAGSMTLMNYMYNAAAKDGTEMAVVGRGTAMDRLLMGEQSKARFDPTKFNWIGSMNNELSTFLVWQDKPTSLDDILKGKQIVVGAAGAGSDPFIYAVALNALLGTHLKIISAYPGMNEIELAMEKGEIDGVTGVSWASIRADKPEWLKSGRAKVLLQLGLQRHPDMPDVPGVTELVKNENDRKVMDMVFARQSMGRPFLTPPGVPPERVKVLREAFAKTMQDPQLIAESKKMYLELNLMRGEDVQALIEKVQHSPKDVVARAQQIFATP